MKKKYIFIILIFLLTVICAVGGSTWIILSEQTAAPKEFTESDKFETKITLLKNCYDENNTFTGEKIYYGENIDDEIKSGVKITSDINGKKVNLTSIFDINFEEVESTEELTGTGTSEESVTGALELSFAFKKDLEEDYKYVYKIPSNVTINVPMYAVAKVVTDTTDYYSTIDQALEAVQTATSGTVNVIPSSYSTETTSESKTKNFVKAKTITSDYTIPKGVIFTLSYSGNSYFQIFDTYSNYNQYDITAFSKKKHSYYTSEENANANKPTELGIPYELYLKNQVTLAEGVTLKNYGTFIVGGKVGGGNGGRSYSSHTAADFAQLTLDNNAQIINYSTGGDISISQFVTNTETMKYTETSYDSAGFQCFGLITEVTAGKSKGILNEGSMMTPFTVRNHRGGSVYFGMSNINIVSLGITALAGRVYNIAPECMPFNRFYFPNITTPLEIPYNATEQKGALFGYVDLYANNAHQITSVGLVGNNSNYIIQLKANASFTADYNDQTEINNLDIYGSASFNTMAMPLTATAAGMTAKVAISMENAHFPISWYYDVKLHKAKNGNTATVSFQQNMKIMPGGSLTIDKGVSLTASELSVYGKDFENGFNPSKTTYIPPKYGTTYPSSSSKSGTAFADGQLIVNGELTVSTFGGIVKTTNSGAKLTVTTNSLTIPELNDCTGSGTDAKASFYDNTETLSLTLVDGKTTNTAGTYYSKDGAWFKDSATITYKDESGNTLSTKDVPLTANGYTLSESDLAAEKDHYTFNGYYYTENDVEKKATTSTVIYGDIELTQKWSKVEYTIQYNVTYPNGYSPITIDDSKFTIGNTVTLALPTYGQLTFLGWFDSSGATITKVNTADLDSGRLSADDNNIITLYGQFVSDYIVTFNINNDEIAEKIGRETEKTYDVSITAAPNEVLTAEQLAKFPNAKATKYDEDISVSVAFVGWFKDAACTQPFDAENDIIERNTVLYAGWENKHTVTVTTENGYFADSNFYIKDGNLFKFSETEETVTAHDSDTTEDYKQYFSGFDGGYTLNDSVQINKSITFTATWADKVHIIYQSESTTISEFYKKPNEEITTLDAQSQARKLISGTYGTDPSVTLGVWTFTQWKVSETNETKTANSIYKVGETNTTLTFVAQYSYTDPTYYMIKGTNISYSTVTIALTSGNFLESSLTTSTDNKTITSTNDYAYASEKASATISTVITYKTSWSGYTYTFKVGETDLSKDLSRKAWNNWDQIGSTSLSITGYTTVESTRS